MVDHYRIDGFSLGIGFGPFFSKGDIPFGQMHLEKIVKHGLAPFPDFPRLLHEFSVQTSKFRNDRQVPSCGRKDIFPAGQRSIQFAKYVGQYGKINLDV